jgi:lipoprotein-anchoring transpeptidase ErfK/SrfK
MKFRAITRNLQAAVMIAVAAPVMAQAVPNPGQQPVRPPVMTSEPSVNAPAAMTPPVIAPPPVPTITAPSVPAPKIVKKKGPVDSLKPGQYVWEQQASYDGPMKIVAVLDIQRLYVFHNDKLVGFTTISTGKKGKETPTGIFNILQKNIDHKSNLYSNAPMPFMQRLTWDGIALHAGHIPGYAASHGCIRMPRAFAKSLYEATKMDQEVVVLKDTSTPAKRPEPKPLPVIDPPVVPVDPVWDPAVTPQASPPTPVARRF